MSVPAKQATSVMTRRRFLVRCAAVGAGVSLAGLTGCNNGFDPKDPWKLWIAKTLQGTVQSTVGTYPIIGAHVYFRAGLKLNEYALLGTTTTGNSGNYEMVAADHPSADAGFWRFIIDSSFFHSSSDDITIYCQLEASLENRQVINDFTLLRRPQKILPPDNGAFHLIQNLWMD